MGDGTVEVVISGLPRESAEGAVMIDALAGFLVRTSCHQVKLSCQCGREQRQSPFILDPLLVSSQESGTP